MNNGPMLPEHDIELVFDCEITNDDIKQVLLIVILSSFNYLGVGGGVTDEKVELCLLNGSGPCWIFIYWIIF